MFKITFRSLGLAGVVLTAALFAAVAQARTATDLYTVAPLVSDGSTTAEAAVDPSLVNGWGLSAGPTTPWWVSDNGTNVSTLYSGTGAKTPLTVSVPGAPTGTVFNGSTTDFPVSQGGASGASRFLFSTEGGTILGWNPAVNGTVALAGADRSGVGAVYKGLATANDRLYATDFHNGRVDVFDASFNLISTPGAFSDPTIAKGFAPFGIQALGGNIFVTYAKQDATAHDDVPVPGQAYVDEFTPDGQLVAHIVNSGKKNAPLTAPWGLALAPADFGVFAADLLVGNFGNGRVSAYIHRQWWGSRGQYAASVADAIDSLWAIAFGARPPGRRTRSPLPARGREAGLFGSIWPADEDSPRPTAGNGAGRGSPRLCSISPQSRRMGGVRRVRVVRAEPPSSAGLQWREIPAGPFSMGSDIAAAYPPDEDESPRRLVSLEPFRLARTPVTNAEYASFAGATGRPMPEGEGDVPATYVSWNDALAFCAWADVWVATEAEWSCGARRTGRSGRGRRAVDPSRALRGIGRRGSSECPARAPRHMGCSGWRERLGVDRAPMGKDGRARSAAERSCTAPTRFAAPSAIRCTPRHAITTPLPGGAGGGESRLPFDWVEIPGGEVPVGRDSTVRWRGCGRSTATPPIRRPRCP